MIDTLKAALILLVVLAVFGLVGRMDYQDEQEQERAYECMRATGSWSCDEPENQHEICILKQVDTTMYQYMHICFIDDSPLSSIVHAYLGEQQCKQNA